MHVLGLQRARPGSSYVSMTDWLPMLRAVKSPDELERMAAAGAAADAAFTDLLGVRFAGRTERAVAADLTDLLVRHGHECRLRNRRLRTERRQPHHERAIG